MREKRATGFFPASGKTRPVAEVSIPRLRHDAVVGRDVCAVRNRGYYSTCRVKKGVLIWYAGGGGVAAVTAFAPGGKHGAEWPAAALRGDDEGWQAVPGMGDGEGGVVRGARRAATTAGVAAGRTTMCGDDAAGDALRAVGGARWHGVWGTLARVLGTGTRIGAAMPGGDGEGGALPTVGDGGRGGMQGARAAAAAPGATAGGATVRGADEDGRAV